jgi:hypothetical protein
MLRKCSGIVSSSVNMNVVQLLWLNLFVGNVLYLHLHM